MLINAARILAVLLVLYALAMLVAWRFQDRFAFPGPGGPLPSPVQFGMPDGRIVTVVTSDSVSLHGWYLPPHPVPVDEGAAPGLIWFYGNMETIGGLAPILKEFRPPGMGMLVLDYRGYGLSEGRPDEAGVYADARAGLAHLVEHVGIPERRTVVFGRSLGGAVAIDLVQDREIGGLILESTFPSVAAMARTIFGSPFAWFTRGRFDSERKIARLRAPLLFFHGDRDEIVDFELGKRLFRAAPEPKAFETIRGAGHNDTVEVGGRPYFERIRRFLDEVTPP